MSEVTVAELRRFLKAARPLLAPVQTPEVREVTADRLALLLSDLRPHLASARQDGALANVWAVAGLGRSEVKTASVLAWFLDPTAGHGAGDAYAQALWQLVRNREEIDDPELDFDIVGLRRATTEVCFFGDHADRIDLVLESDAALIFIEVKIDAVQQPHQLERYVAKAARVAQLRGKAHWALLYLSNLDDELPQRCRRISWRDVATALRRATSDAGRDSFFQLAAQQFADHIGQLH